MLVQFSEKSEARPRRPTFTERSRRRAEINLPLSGKLACQLDVPPRLRSLSRRNDRSFDESRVRPAQRPRLLVQGDAATSPWVGTAGSFTPPRHAEDPEKKSATDGSANGAIQGVSNHRSYQASAWWDRPESRHLLRTFLPRGCVRQPRHGSSPQGNHGRRAHPAASTSSPAGERTCAGRGCMNAIGPLGPTHPYAFRRATPEAVGGLF